MNIVNLAPAPPGVIPTGKVFDLSIAWNGPEQHDPLELLKPVLLTVGLNGEELAIAVKDPARIKIYHINEGDRPWEPMPTTVDLKAATAQALTGSLSIFALTISTPEQAPAAVLLDIPPFTRAGPSQEPANKSGDKSTEVPTEPRDHPMISRPPSLGLESTGAFSLDLAPTATSVTGTEKTPTPTREMIATPTQAPAPSPSAPPAMVSVLVPIASPVPRPEPIPAKAWKLNRTEVFGSTVRVFINGSGFAVPRVSLNGMETPETYISEEYQEHVFRSVSPGEHRVRAWTPSVPTQEETRLVTVVPPTPTPVPSPTATPIPRYRLFINGVPVPPRHILVSLDDGTVSLSKGPEYDGRYLVGTEVTIVASPKAGFRVSWGGVDSQTGGFGTVELVADRYVDLEIERQSPSPPQAVGANSTPPPTVTGTPAPKRTATPTPTKRSKSRSTATPTATRPSTPIPTTTPAPTPIPTAIPAPTPIPTPVSTNPNGERLVASDRDGDFEIYIVDANESTWERLTDNDSDDIDPAWSPDWRRVVFASDRTGNWEIFAMDQDGVNQDPLTNNPADDRFPAWSRDGKEVVWGTNRNGEWETWVMCAGGSFRRPVNTPLELPPCS